MEAVSPDAQVFAPCQVARGPGGPERVSVCHLGGHDGETHDGPVGSENSSGEKEEDEPVVVAIANALVDEDAVMIHSADTPSADVAVLGARGLEETAGVALESRLVDGEVIGVEFHVVGVIFIVDVSRVTCRSQVKEDVREDHEDGASGSVERGEVWPCRWEI